MTPSKFMLRVANLTLDVLFKSADTDIRVHGLENVPDKNVLYVVNHFTRIETAIIPHALKKHLGQLSISLASHEFFNESSKKFLNSIGAVSTKDPDLDRILTSSLLKGDMAVVVYPEGQMIKDKKLVEKGKFLVYNSGIRRPPHTGAARIALRVELLRQAIKKFHENGHDSEIKKIFSKFDLKNRDLTGIIMGTTQIVPVNITYYPIRAKNNLIKRAVELFKGETTGRFAEELEVEGTMLSQGVDIDINFGRPLKINRFLKNTGLLKKAMEYTDEMDTFEAIRKLSIRKPSIRLMQRYMRAIYGLTTVNHDHIFAYILKKHPHTRIGDYDFKNRASLAIERIRMQKVNNFHTTLVKGDENIGADIFHEKYQSFIDECVRNGLVEMDGHVIVKNRKKFSSTFAFHRIRKDNFLEVLCNEIEPLSELMSILRRIMILPPLIIKMQIKKTFLKLDKDIFHEDYRVNMIEGESKPPCIGEPFFFKSPFNRHGVILIHGYMSAPEEVRQLAEKIHSAGYAVYAVRLRGHGTSPEDLAGRNWKEWNESVNRGYVIMKNSVKDFAVAGFSTGAGLALLQAAKKPDKFRGVISISAPLKLNDIRAHFSGAVTLYNNLLKRFHIEKGKKDFVPNEPENPQINYFRNPISGTHELGKLMDVVNRNLKKIKIPALIIQGDHDPTVNPESAEKIYSKIGSTKKELVYISSEKHGIIRDDKLEDAAPHVLKFLKEIF